MAENPVTPGDIEARWRPLSEQEQTTAFALLDDVWAQAQAYVPALSANLDSGSVSEPLVKSVLVSAVLRVLRNPEGLREQQIDDYKYTRDTTLSSGGLYLSDVELALLGRTSKRAVSMPLGSRFGGTSWR